MSGAALPTAAPVNLGKSPVETVPVNDAGLRIPGKADCPAPIPDRLSRGALLVPAPDPPVADLLDQFMGSARRGVCESCTFGELDADSYRQTGFQSARFGMVCMLTACARKVFGHLLVCVAAQLAACASIAEEAEIGGVAVVKDWTVYQSRAGDLECGIIAKPTQTINTKDGKPAPDVKRGDILLAVTIDPSSTSSRYLVSFRSGYPFRRDSIVSMRIGNRTFTLAIGQTEADSEWAWPPADDDIIVAAMKRGTDAVLTAVSRRNTDTQDTFSLLGVTDALKIAEGRCST